jgi:hypothetical protein
LRGGLSASKRAFDLGGRFIVTSNDVDLRHGDLPKGHVREPVNPENGRRIHYWDRRKVHAKSHTGVSYQNYSEHDEREIHRKAGVQEQVPCLHEKRAREADELNGSAVKNLDGDYSRGKFTTRSPFMIYELVAKNRISAP